MAPLAPNAKKAFRQEVTAYCKLAEQYEQRWHYSQRRPYTGLGPRHRPGTRTTAARMPPSSSIGVGGTRCTPCATR